ENDALRGRKSQRLGRTALSHDGIPRRLATDQRKVAVFSHGEARHRIVAAVRRKQEPSILRQDDTTGTLEGVRRAFLTADGLEWPRSCSARVDALSLGERPVGSPPIMNNAVPLLV